MTIAYLMLKNNEPYRYAVPEATNRKLSRIRFSVTGVRRKPVKAGQKTTNTKSPAGQHPRCRRSLPDIYRDEGLPVAKGMDEVAAAERRVLRAAKVESFVRGLQAPPT